MLLSQELISAEVGDVIRFIATDRSHNAQSVKDALPEGREAFRGRMNHGIQFPEDGDITTTDFSGGEEAVKNPLEATTSQHRLKDYRSDNSQTLFG
jgi:hypothetical protein